MTRLRVGFDVLAFAGERTGIGRFCTGLAGALVAGEEVELLGYAVARNARRATGATAGALGIPVRTWPLPARLANSVWARADLPPIEWLTGPVDVVHGTNYVVPPSAHAGRVVTVYDLTAVRYPQLCAPASRQYPRLVRRAVRGGAFVHVLSGFVRDEVLELIGADAARVRVVPAGLAVPSDDATRSPARSGRRERSAPYLLALGAVEPRKDLPTLVKAFAELSRTHGDLELVVAGPDGWGEPAFRAAVEASGVAGRVVRVGYLAEAERQSLLEGALALAYPSVYEGFGFPPLEAMAAGVPVVATSAGAVPEVVGDAAELVAPGDHEAMAAALARVIDDDALRARLVHCGRVRASSFSWESAAASMIDLYGVAARDRRAR
ncbi:MAG: glycosyltransferase family 1 protein [Acidimicrobiales bacterium]